jgi:hypothetical protein
MSFSRLKADLRKAAERTIPRLRRRIGRFARTLMPAKLPIISGTRAMSEIDRNMLQRPFAMKARVFLLKRAPPNVPPGRQEGHFRIARPARDLVTHFRLIRNRSHHCVVQKFRAVPSLSVTRRRSCCGLLFSESSAVLQYSGKEDLRFEPRTSQKGFASVGTNKLRSPVGTYHVRKSCSNETRKWRRYGAFQNGESSRR